MMMEHVAEQKQWGELMRRRADGLMEAYQLNEDVGEDMDGIGMFLLSRVQGTQRRNLTVCR
jgi:hypothetical protein